MLGGGRWRRPRGAPVLEELSAGTGPEGPLLLVCGERLDRPERDALAARLSVDAPANRAIAVSRLCTEPDIVLASLAVRRAGSVVVVGCDSAGAASAIRAAVSAGLDTARSAAISLAPALHQSPPSDRLRLMTAICLAGARRAGVLVGEPLAGRERLQLRGTLDRRALLTAWREGPRRTASLDATRCPGASRCGACVGACPTGAPRAEGGRLRIDPLRCVSCGSCAFACPTGALSLPGAALDGVAAELDTLLVEGVTSFVLSCERIPAAAEAAVVDRLGEPSAVLTLPCAARASAGLLLGLLARGARVELAPCPACEHRHALASALELTGRLLDSLDRRDLRERLVVEAAEQAREAPATPIRRAAGAPGETAGTFALREPMATNSAVALLLALSDALPGAAEAIFDEDAPTGVVRVDATACTFCGACAMVCPSGAITSEVAGAELRIDPTRCLGCGRCAIACPERAVVAAKGVDLRGLRDGPVRLQRPAAPSTCARCGTPLDDGPILASVHARLAAAGANEALLAGLARCRSCGVAVAPPAGHAPCGAGRDPISATLSC